MSREIRKLDLSNHNELELAFPLMQQLRSHLNFSRFCDLISVMTQEHYELWAYFEDRRIVGVASTRKYTDLVRGTHIYIDDLVSDQQVRSKGIGAALLNHIETVTKERGYISLRLCCVKENEGGMKFYRREGWQERAFALVKKVKN